MWIRIVSILCVVFASSGQQFNLQAQALGTTEPPVRYALLLRELEAVTNGRKSLQTQLTAYQQQYNMLYQQILAQKGIVFKRKNCLFLLTFLKHDRYLGHLFICLESRC